jgi:CheY-like chemotaxis protein
MSDKKANILWIDDEIDLLRSHVLYLKDKGYNVETATNGEDAIEMVRKRAYDLVFLDEMMSGMGGLETLAAIKQLHPDIPVVMVTKNEAESLMEEAIGGKISDYLTKPVNPSQVLLTCKKFLEGKKIASEYVSRDYVQEFQKISSVLMSSPNVDDWIEIYRKLTDWEIELDEHPELGLRQTLADQRRECNVEFGKFIERNYRTWLEQADDRPTLSVDVVEKFVIPSLSEKRSVFFLVIDCLRLDQWLGMEAMLRDLYDIKKQYYYSILPTATPYARNAIFSGLFPNEIEQRFPELWAKGEDDDNSRNRYERQLLDKLLERKRVSLRPEPRYIKILDAEVGRSTEQNILTYTQNRLTSIVVNFVDILAHSRSDSDVLKEIAPDEPAYRSLTKTWFLHSSLYNMFRALATQENVRIVVTTDHGSVRSLRGARVLGDREASTSLRYKYGRNLKCDERQALYVKNPTDFRLPKRGVTINYIIAKEDYYFVYPTDYHKYLSQYRDSFQHGGISMEEMILPVITLDPKG